MVSGILPARDVKLIDAVDACARESFAGPVWRVVREGRPPLLPSTSFSRWCDGTFEVLYTSLEAQGAIAEVGAYLNLLPVFPSRIQHELRQIDATASRTLRLVDMNALAGLGVDVARYGERKYEQTAAIAEIAMFLNFDGLIAPSARYSCLNLVLFTELLAPGQLQLVGKPERIDWAAWRKRPA